MPFGIEWQPKIDLATADQVLPIVKAGVGIGFVPDFMAKQNLEQGTVSQIALAGIEAKRNIVLLEDKSKNLNVAATEMKHMMLSVSDDNALFHD